MATAKDAATDETAAPPADTVDEEAVAAADRLANPTKMYVKANAAVFGLRAFETGWVVDNDESQALLLTGLLERAEP